MAAWTATCQPIIAAYKKFQQLYLQAISGRWCSTTWRGTKSQSTSLNLFIVEQLPLVARVGFRQLIGTRSAEEIVRRILALSYTSHDLAPFARDQGYVGQPFVWEAEDRLHRRARLNAVFMLLYGLDRDTAGYILNTFPILKRQEEAGTNGRYRTRDLVLRYMAAMEAGNPDAVVTG